MTAIIMRIVAAIGIVVMVPFYGLTGLINMFSNPTESSSVNIVGVGAYFRSQGITADSDGNLYFSSKTTLVKTDSTGRKYLAANLSAIPDKLAGENGIKHIGGISWYNGKIYAGMEDSKKWKHPTVGVFDAETLEFLESFELDCTVHTRGLPWVTVDGQTGILYAFDHSKTPEKILSYNINSGMSPVEEIPLAQTIKSVQGAEFYNGYLYAATNDDTQAIYAVDVTDGTSEKFVDRSLLGGEGEGMTFVKKDGKTYLCAMDMGTLFINTFLRYWEMD